MPIFEFACLDCGVEFEKLLRKAGVISEVNCPVCKSRNIEEKISAFSSIGKSGSSGGGSCAPSGG
jgi:putative FmdB family regulatory protein